MFRYAPERQIEMLKNPALKLGTSLPRFVLTVAGRFGRVKRVPASFAMLRPTWHMSAASRHSASFAAGSRCIE